MNKYSSIETYFVRDRETKKLDTTRVRQPVHTQVREYALTEKVDGQNWRIRYSNTGREILGRTDNANLHPKVIADIAPTLPTVDQVCDHFNLGDGEVITLYGEAYGPKIQSGGKYRSDHAFIMFDVCYTNTETNYQRFFDYETVRGIGHEWSITVVPIVGFVTPVDIPKTVYDLELFIPYSIVARKGTDNTHTQAEGVVARPLHEMKDGRGNRLMWKLCFRDLS